MKRTSLTTADCPVARSLDVIGDWWSLLIVRDAFDRVSRFGQFQKNLGIARGMLTTRLRDLVDRGVLETTQASDGTSYQEYALTARGRALFPVIVALRQWGEDTLYAPGEAHSQLVARQDGQPLEHLQVRTRDGRAIGPEDAVVQKLEPAE